MAQPWASTVENLRGPAAPPAPAPTEWTAQKLRAGLPQGTAGTPAGFDRPPGGVPRSAGYSAPPGAAGYSAPTTVSEALGAERRASKLRSLSTSAGRAVGGAAPRLAPTLLAAEAGSHFNDFKINDPSTDSSAAGTFAALRKGDFSGAGRSLSKGMLETGMDLGSAAANLADAFVPGKAPVSSAYGRMLRSTFGDQLADNTGAAPTAPAQSITTGRLPAGFAAGVAAPPAAVPAAAGIPGAPPTGNAPGTFRYNDGSTGQGTVSSLQTPGVGGYLRQLANIRSLGDAPAMMADGTEAPTPGLAGIDGNQTLGSALRAKTDATSSRAPKGLSPRQLATYQQAEADRTQRGEIASAQLGVTAQGQSQGLRIAEMSNATQRRNNDQNNASTLRGQDMHLEGQMLPVQLAELRRRAMADAYAPGEGGKPADHLTAADRLDRAGFREEAAAARTAASQNQAIRGAGDEQARKSHDDLVNMFRGDQRFNIPDPANPGKTIFDDAGAKRAAAQLYAEHGEKLDGLPPEKKKAFASEIIATQRLQDRLRRPEMGALDHVANVFGQYKRPADNEALPDLRGAKARRRGATLIPGNMTNDILLDLPDGRTYNAGELSAPETAVLRSRGVNLDR